MCAFLARILKMPTMKALPIEEHVRCVVKDLLRTRGAGRARTTVELLAEPPTPAPPAAAAKSVAAADASPAPDDAAALDTAAAARAAAGVFPGSSAVPAPVFEKSQPAAPAAPRSRAKGKRGSRKREGGESGSDSD